MKIQIKETEQKGLNQNVHQQRKTYTHKKSSSIQPMIINMGFVTKILNITTTTTKMVKITSFAIFGWTNIFGYCFFLYCPSVWCLFNNLASADYPKIGIAARIRADYFFIGIPQVDMLPMIRQINTICSMLMHFSLYLPLFGTVFCSLFWPILRHL